jgi:hypothetical protein
MNRFFKTVLLTGLFVGTTDLVSAYVSSAIRTGNFPRKMLYYIAAGAIGLKTSLEGGNLTAFLGLFFHYFISFSFTLFFFWIFPHIKILAFNKWLVGMLYAVFVNLVMNLLVLRFCQLPYSPFSLADSVMDWVILGVLFGIPIVYNAYGYYGKNIKTLKPT